MNIYIILTLYQTKPHDTGTYCEWRPFNHPQLGTVELGGADKFRLITNPPPHLMLKEVEVRF